MVVSGILGTIMQGPMKSQMGKVLANAQEELKHYIEKSEPRRKDDSGMISAPSRGLNAVSQLKSQFAT